MRGERAVVGTDLDEGRVEELDLFVSEVGEVPERERAAVVYATGDEGGPAEEMEFSDAIDGRFGLERALGVLGIKVDRKHLCPITGSVEASAWTRDALGRLHRQYGRAGRVGIEDDAAIGAVDMPELCDACWVVAGDVPALQEVGSRPSGHAYRDEPAIRSGGQELEKDDLRVGFGVEGDGSAGDGSRGGPCVVEGEGAVGEGLEIVGGEVVEGCGAGEGDVPFEDVHAEEQGPEGAQVRGGVEGLARLERVSARRGATTDTHAAEGEHTLEGEVHDDVEEDVERDGVHADEHARWGDL